MSQRKKLSSVERLKNFGKVLAEEKLEVVDSPEAIEVTRETFLRIAHGHNPISPSRRPPRKPSNAPFSPPVDGIPLPWQFPKGKE